MVSSRVHSNDVQRLFLQAVMSRRIMSDKMVKALWKKCTEAVKKAAPELGIEVGSTEAEWNTFLNKVNDSINPFDLELKFTVDEVTSVKMWALVNTKGDEVAQFASDYNPTEIAFFRALIEQIVLASNYSFSISSLAALRETSHIKVATFTKAVGEVVLGSFVARGWLSRSRKGRYSLGSRTLLELGSYLTQAYGEDVILDCTICQEIVTKGVRCATPNCKTFLHKHCHTRVLRTRNTCPSCQSNWANSSNIKPIGEEAASGHDERRKTRRSSAGNGDEEEEEEEEQSQYLDDSQALSQYQSQSQSQRQTQSQSQSQSQSQTQSQSQRKSKSRKSANGRSKKRAETPPETEEEEDGTMDIDDLPAIREKPSRLHKRG